MSTHKMTKPQKVDADNFPINSDGFDKLPLDRSWSFSDLTQKHTRYISHGYFTYPAKFIPQLAKRLICEYTGTGETVVDPFMGSGTTVIEALVADRKAVGTDINPVAFLVAKVKSTPIKPSILEEVFAKVAIDLTSQLKDKSNLFAHAHQAVIPTNERIDYWFPPMQKEHLGIILGTILDIEDLDCREFFEVAFAQVLKACSIWMQKSIKPTRDPKKIPSDPLTEFLRQSKFMLTRNRDFWDLIPAHVRENPSAYRKIKCGDARALPIESDNASLIVTSPPYVTSYEYADLHQLSALWLSYTKSLNEFRTDFIGSAYSSRATINVRSSLADKISSSLQSAKKRREVNNYFADMLECFVEMYRVLRVGGKACIVIGNTKFDGVDIKNAEVFEEQMVNVGFETYKIIKREVPSKILPQTRDPESGQFTSSKNSNKVLAYPIEYILIMEKTK